VPWTLEQKVAPISVESLEARTKQSHNALNISQALGFTQALTEITTRNIKIMFLGSKVRRVRKADNLTATYEPIV
jgi:hypothetical protein